jgi:carbon-monoxide dehydrogenase medium subunit
MKPALFELHRPSTVQEALSLLGDVAEEGGLILAGGQSLVPMMALRLAYPPHLIDINAIDGLDRVAVEDGCLVVGATARHAYFHRPVVEGCLGRLLTAVSRHIAHYPIRMRGTMCGSLAHADPASEWCLTAATLGAEIVLANNSGTRSVPAEDYLAGAMTTLREADEMLLEVRIPLFSDDARFGFYEFNRRAGDFALGMCLATYDLVDGVMSGVKIGIGGIEEKPRRLTEAEQILEGQQPGYSLFADAGVASSDSVDPLDDVTTSAEYRRDLTAVVVRRALAAAMSGSAGTGGAHG